MVHVLPELKEEECELDELPARRESLFFKKRKRANFEEDEEEARAAGGGRGLLPPLDAARREHLATVGSGFKTVNEEQLARALRGDLAPEDVVRPPGAGALPTAMPSRGGLAGVNLLVAPVQRLQQEDEGRTKWKDGDLTVVLKTKKCKDMDEWERSFFRIMCEAPAEARDDLVDFLAWAKTIAADYTFYHFSEFYEYLVRQVQRSTVGISLDGYDRVWRVYKQQHSLQPGSLRRGEESSKGAPAGAVKVPVVTPGPAVEAEMEPAPAVEVEIEDEDALVERNLRPDEFIPVWDVLGGPRRHDRVSMTWEVERIAPLPVTQQATIKNMEAGGTGENERRCYEKECERVGCNIPTLTSRAHLVAAAFQGWHDVEFLVRCAACGAGWPSEEIEVDEPYQVPNYVGPEHMEVMRDELKRESEAGHIFLARWRLPLGIIALGMVEKVRKGKEFGPFTMDSCVAESRAKSYCYLSRSRVEHARVQKFDGHNAWGNLPFSIHHVGHPRELPEVQTGTAACFLVPVWDGNEGWELVKRLPHVFKVVREWAKGTHLFTAPTCGGMAGPQDR
ncbi:hypothetical protein CYMTET_37249 [Cymbomonas tetramitiformis]|uniref:Uncharacterized protein n=1 Tax=Cymbomonas tetramitiformis TaxID=36881 RepID=A0AAE0CE94_9CHLO|nr:hypothetical protein CYMTET_37249 [Cymbomonas tetramitiformis]